MDTVSPSETATSGQVATTSSTPITAAPPTLNANEEPRVEVSIVGSPEVFGAQEAVTVTNRQDLQRATRKGLSRDAMWQHRRLILVHLKNATVVRMLVALKCLRPNLLAVHSYLELPHHRGVLRRTSSANR
ncbi:hypothetical protein OSTOST_18109 [Ostertagia ostertagi]